MIILLPSRYEIRALHALKDRGFVISTVRFPSGTNRNVAIDVEKQHATMREIWIRLTGGK